MLVNYDIPSCKLNYHRLNLAHKLNISLFICILMYCFFYLIYSSVHGMHIFIYFMNENVHNKYFEKIAMFLIIME